MDEVRNSINDIKAKADVHCEQVHSWNPPFYKGGFEFSKFSEKERGSQFSHKQARVGKIGWF